MAKREETFLTPQSTLRQQVFALDAKYNTHRASSSNFRTLYIRRRSQLLRDSNREPEKWKQYLRLRATILNQRYGNGAGDNLHRSFSRLSISNDSKNTSSCIERVVPTKQASASKAIVGDNSIADNYAFVGVHHIFEQHKEAVTVLKFANNDRSTLCCASEDGTLSICNVTNNPPTVTATLTGHTKAITGFDWSINNDLIVSSSLDCSIKLWNMTNFTCLRTIQDPQNAHIFCCIFQPINNNLVITGNSQGEIRMANVSTGIFAKLGCMIGGKVLCITTDTNGKIIWAGNNKGEIVSLSCDISGNLQRLKKITLGVTCAVTSLSYKAWISREARNPLLLVNCAINALCLFSVADKEGGLHLKIKFQNNHKKCPVKSTFCPLMSFRQGACIVTGSEDGNVYFLDIEKPTNRACVNTLQGHTSAVFGVSFNYDESLLATSDLEGLVIVWKRTDEDQM